MDWVVFAAVVLLSIPWLVSAASDQGDHLWVALLLWPFGTVPVLWRRTHPGAVLAVMLACAMVAVSLAGLADQNGAARGAAFSGGVGPLIAAYSAALYGAGRTRVIAAVSAALVLATAFGVVLATGTARPLGHLAGLSFGYGVAWVAGDRTLTRRAYLEQLEARAVAAERQRDEHVRRAAEMERARIARELHDVVAHQVSVIAVQAGAARATHDTDPRRSMEALGLVERMARATLVELRALLGILRKNDGSSPPLRPSPTIASLGELAAQARATGLDVTLHVEGTEARLPTVLELCAYRMVQEALTNAIKHAPHARVDVDVVQTSEELRIRVADNGPGAPSDGRITGHGLVGMRERVEMVGGTLQIDTAPGRGFAVVARLPLEGTPSDQALAASSSRALRR